MHKKESFCILEQINNFFIYVNLIPKLHPGQVVILDHAAFLKSQETKKLIKEAGCRMLFLLPYSPDLNPMELFWANLQRKIQR